MMHQEYDNQEINMQSLLNAVKSLRKDPVMKVYESENPVAFIFGFFKK
jgi:hypothetical protein